VYEAKHAYNNNHIRIQHNGFGQVFFEFLCSAMGAAVRYSCKIIIGHASRREKSREEMPCALGLDFADAEKGAAKIGLT
jgi:hypothetical protein